MKFLTNIAMSKIKKEQFDSLSKKEIKNKDIVLRYMKSVKANVMTTFVFSDVITGEKVTWNLGHNDGEFTWYEADIYYFERYNIEISEEFIHKALRMMSSLDCQIT